VPESVLPTPRPAEPAIGTASVPVYAPPVVIPTQAIPVQVPMAVPVPSAVPVPMAVPVPSAVPMVSAIPVTGYPAYTTVYGAPYPPPVYGFPPPPYGYPFIPPPPPPPASRAPGWLRWGALLVVLLVVGTMSAGGGLLVGLAQGDTGVTSSWHSASPLPSVAQPPAANAPIAEWSSWAHQAAKAEVTAQGQALLSGNEAGYVAPADPGNTDLVAELKMRFADLHAMGLGAWTQTLGSMQSAGNHIWTADLTIDYCFGDATCSAAELTETTRWSVVGGRLVLSKLDPAGPDDNGPRPWETDTLTVKTGKRVVVASTKVDAWRVANAVTVADNAAAVTDTFAKWEPAPSRYVIFFAGPNDWKRWYGMDEPDWAAAWSVPVARSVTEIVVRSDVVSQSDLPVLLTHEMTHVTTLAGPRYGATVDNWWLIEGIAEYGSHLNVQLRDYDGVDATEQYVRTKWDGNPAVAAPNQNATQIEAGGKYGIAWLSVRRIAERYGKDKMLDFWGRIVHQAEPIDTASREALGVPWATVKADCSQYVRNQVNAL
jgi:hypothetical protein